MSELEKLVHELQREVAALRAAKTGAMRQTQCCPECGNRTILHFTKVTERRQGGLEPLSLRHETTGAFFVEIQNAAPLQAFACRACGKVEWYATGLDEVKVDGEVVRLLGADPAAADAGPYR